MSSKLMDFLKDGNLETQLERLTSDPYNCVIKEDSDFPAYRLISYNQIKSDFHNPIVRECRGIIIDIESIEVVCRAFDKFGNYGESYVPEMHWPSVRVEEKIDGSLVRCWYSFRYGKWMISTNGTIDAYKAPIQNDLSPYKSFGELIYAILEEKQFTFDPLDKTNTYMFELVSPYTRVVVLYPQPDLYFLGSRTTKTGEYQSELLVGFQKPKIWEATCIEDVLTMAKDLPYDREGYVVVDEKGNRIKVKGREYLILHRTKGNDFTMAKAFDLVKMNEYKEFLSYFPEYESTIHKVISILEKCRSYLFEKVELINSMEFKNRKEYALLVNDWHFKGFFFQRLDSNVSISDYINELKWDKIPSDLKCVPPQ